VGSGRCIRNRNIKKKINQYVSQGKAEKTGDSYTINLQKIEITKLLGRGKIKTKLNITVKKATEKAINIIKKAGGTVITQKEEKVKE